MTRTTDLPTGKSPERLAMNSHAARWCKPEDRAAIEHAIPDGYRMTVMYGTSPGDWSIRIFDDDGALCIIQRHQRTIKGGAFVALAKLAAAA